MKGPRRLASLLVALLTALTPAGSSGQEPRKRAEGLARAPVTARGWVNPYEGDPTAVVAGRKLFGRHCVECHGSDGRGSGHAPPLDSVMVRLAPPGALFWLLTNGDLWAGMPSWSRLPPERRWQIVSFLTTLPPSPSPPPLGQGAR